MRTEPRKRRGLGNITLNAWRRRAAHLLALLAARRSSVERMLFRRLFGGLPPEVEDALERAAAQPHGRQMVSTLLSVLRGLHPTERLAWAAAADELPNRTSVSAYWVSLVALLLATAALLSGVMQFVVLVATACGIFLARYQARYASRLRIAGNVLRSLVAPDGSIRTRRSKRQVARRRGVTRRALARDRAGDG